MNDPLTKPEGPLTWNAAAPQLPEMPMISPGADAMSMTIAAVLPTLAAELTASVTALSVKENMYSGKLTAAESAYANADDQGSSSVGQLTSMLGDLGKMAQSAGGGSSGGGAGGGGGIFSSLMEQAMKMAEGMGGAKDQGAEDPNARDEGDRDAAAQGAGAQGVAGQAAPPQGSQGQASSGQGAAGHAVPAQGQQGPTHSPTQPPADRDSRWEAERHQQPPAAAAGPGDGQRGAGPAPITQQEPAHRRGDEDLSRRL
jgi:hypothetical protein